MNASFNQDLLEHLRVYTSEEYVSDKLSPSEAKMSSLEFLTRDVSELRECSASDGDALAANPAITLLEWALFNSRELDGIIAAKERELVDHVLELRSLRFTQEYVLEYAQLTTEARP